MVIVEGSISLPNPYVHTMLDIADVRAWSQVWRYHESHRSGSGDVESIFCVRSFKTLLTK